MKDPRKSATLMKHQSGKMMDSTRMVVPPKVGEDANGRTRMGGNSSTLPDRDGPSKRSASNEPAAKKPPTSSKASKMAGPKTTVKAPIIKAPTTSKPMPQGVQGPTPTPAMGPMQMPPANMIKAMKSTIKGSSGSFKR